MLGTVSVFKIIYDPSILYWILFVRIVTSKFRILGTFFSYIFLFCLLFVIFSLLVSFSLKISWQPIYHRFTDTALTLLVGKSLPEKLYATFLIHSLVCNVAPTSHRCGSGIALGRRTWFVKIASKRIKNGRLNENMATNLISDLQNSRSR